MKTKVKTNIKIGHTEIKNGEVIFVYYELEKPKAIHYSLYGINYLNRSDFLDNLKEYEASRREVKVSNVKQIKWLYFFYFGSTVIMHPDYELKHDQPCEANVTDNKATITKIL